MDVARLQWQNLESLLNAYEYRAHAAKVLDVIARNSSQHGKRALSWILRHHENGAVTSKSEISFRASVDELLGLCSLLEIGSQTDFIDLMESRLEKLRKELSTILGHPDVAKFYREHYPLFLPRLLCARLNGAWNWSEDSADATARLLELLALDARFRKNHGDGVLLEMFDDFVINDVDFDAVEQVLSAPKKLVRTLLADPDEDSFDPLLEAVQEFPHFVQFCVQFEDVLERMERAPLLRSAFWHYYGYWFDILGENLDHKLSNGVRALLKLIEVKQLDQAGEDTPHARKEALRSVERSMSAIKVLTSRQFDGQVRDAVRQAEASTLNYH